MTLRSHSGRFRLCWCWLLRIPIALAMMIIGFVGSYIVFGSNIFTLNQLKTLTYGIFSNYSFSIIPLFLLMGQFATLSGMSASLFKAAESFLGHRKGGVAMSGVGACAGFGAICGSSLATAATMGQVALPELRRYGYPGSLATGSLAAGGTLGILIPPSVILVIPQSWPNRISKAVCRRADPRDPCGAGLHDRHSALDAVLAEFGIGERSCAVGRPATRAHHRLAGAGDLSGGGAWHLLRFFHPHGGCCGWGGWDLYRCAGVRKHEPRQIQAGDPGHGVFECNDLPDHPRADLQHFLSLTYMPQTASAWMGEQAFSPWLVLVCVLLMYLVFGCIMDSCPWSC